MDIWREGKLQNSEVGTGDILSLELHRADIERLCDPAVGYSTNKFQSMKHGLRTHGWAPEDKVHVWLKSPTDEFAPNLPFQLSVDPGGDLIYTIWDSLQSSQLPKSILVEGDGTVVASDPSDKLKHLGITALRIYYLDTLARELHKPNYL